jgi:hypothetical protein
LVPVDYESSPWAEVEDLWNQLIEDVDDAIVILARPFPGHRLARRNLARLQRVLDDVKIEFEGPEDDLGTTVFLFKTGIELGAVATKAVTMAAAIRQTSIALRGVYSLVLTAVDPKERRAACSKLAARVDQLAQSFEVDAADLEARAAWFALSGDFRSARWLQTMARRLRDRAQRVRAALFAVLVAVATRNPDPTARRWRDRVPIAHRPPLASSPLCPHGPPVGRQDVPVSTPAVVALAA